MPKLKQTMKPINASFEAVARSLLQPKKAIISNTSMTYKTTNEKANINKNGDTNRKYKQQ